jgi:hypothetical protein
MKNNTKPIESNNFRSKSARIAIQKRWKNYDLHKQPDGCKETHKTCSKCMVCMPTRLFSAKNGAKFGVAAWCKKCMYAYQKKNRTKDTETLERYRGYARNYWKNPERKKIANAKQLDRHHKLRLEVLLAYGGQCQCCQEKRHKFLAIDHVDPKTKQGKRECGTALYRKCKLQNYPEQFQILCHNCNMAKGLYGECPHTEEKRQLCKKH